jgi:hypothetical protein
VLCTAYFLFGLEHYSALRRTQSTVEYSLLL